MADVLDRIRKLLALAANNAFEEEARTAARKVAQLIKEHGVELRMPGGVGGAGVHGGGARVRPAA